MFDEAAKIITRRSLNRALESGLLVIAVALGIGAASAGMALLANTLTSSAEMLESAEYKEIVVRTAGDGKDMDEPVALKAVEENAVLTSADLEAGELVPAVAYSYVKNHSRMEFINEEYVAEEEQRQSMRPQPSPAPEGGAEGDAFQPPPGDDGFRNASMDDLESYALDSDILISELDNVIGYEVSPDFFSAWDLKTSAGSLFSAADLTGKSSLTVLGHDLAELLAEGREDGMDALVGKKLLTRDGLIMVIGILEQTGNLNDDLFFTPYTSDAGLNSFRRMFMNTELRFTVDDPEELDGAAALLQDWFDSRFGEDQITLSNPRSQALQMISRNTGVSVLILFLSLAGLFIAAVNVSNILMSRAMRMKKHVGILMALGSSRQGILKLFAWEAAGITLTGSLLGTFLSLPLSRTMQSSLDNIEAMGGGSWGFTLIGVLISAALTLLFGLLPARQYSKIDPAVAMRAA
jgi:putative ABC transport system permease protein